MTDTASRSRSVISYFYGAFGVTAVGLGLGAWLGWQSTGTLPGTLQVFFICAVLAVLEISLSFDNAIVNANKLKDMTPLWRRRFLTWGILIAVFGMRILFPLLIVVIAAKVSPWTALVMAGSQPEAYAAIMHDAHLPIAAFGGTFLMMVALTFFFNHEKDIHWVEFLECKCSQYAAIKGIEIGLVLIVTLILSQVIEGREAAALVDGTQAAGTLPIGASTIFLNAAIFGLVTFLIVEVLGGILDKEQEMMTGAAKGGLGAFIYLEVLDASFSFDGVIGAFALSHNLFVIAIGLGIGAMYVRSMTIMLVEKGTLAEYRFLEHGAFYAILILSIIMCVQTLVDIPEIVTGLGGATLIGIAFWASVRWNRRHADKKQAPF